MHRVANPVRAGLCAVAAALGSYLLCIARALPTVIRQQAALLAIIAIYWICGLIVAHSVGIPSIGTITTYVPVYMMMMPYMVATLIIGRGGVIMLVDRPDRPLTQLIKEIQTVHGAPSNVAHALPMLMGMLVFGGTFTVIKASIPVLAPFSWDATFEQWDLWLHGGVAPWQILQPILGWPIVTHLLSYVYNSWFYLLALIWVWQAFSQRDTVLRQQFFLSLMLGWILLGNVAAMLFSSAGPCYFGQVTGLADPYQPLLTYLNDANQVYPVWSLGAQDILWYNYTLREFTMASGISAMPSMHIALATLFALVCWRTKRWLGIVMSIYALAIMIGSVHLAWHYAIDGYLGVLGMIAIWCLVGRVLSRRQIGRRLAVSETA